MTGNEKKIKMRLVALAVLLVLLFWACDLKKQEPAADSSESFIKIYDKPDEYSYTAVDIKQLEDGGYIILGKQIKEETRPYLLRLDKDGNAKWETSYDDFVRKGEEGVLGSYIEPVSDILIFDKKYYIFCSYYWLRVGDTKISYAVLLELSEDDHRPNKVEWVNFNKAAFVYPMDAKTTYDGHILLFALDESENDILLRKIESNGNQISKKPLKFFSYCMNQYPITDKRYNFIEPGNNGFYLHGYMLSGSEYPYNACFIFLWFNMSDLRTNKGPDVLSVGYPYIALECRDNKYCGAYIIGNVISFIINTSPSDLVKYNGIEQFELRESSIVCIKSMNVNNRQVVFFTGSAKNNRIVLYVYDRNTGEPISKKYFGHTHTYESAALIETNDNGLAILGTTYVADQLGRICLFKLSKKDLEEMVE